MNHLIQILLPSLSPESGRRFHHPYQNDVSVDILANELSKNSRRGLDNRVLNLLTRGAPPDSDWYTRERNGKTPLMEACMARAPLTAQYLLKWGARTDVRDRANNTALQYACRRNAAKCVKLLLAHNSPTDIESLIGQIGLDQPNRGGPGYSEMVEIISAHKPQPRDPLSSYPSAKQLSKFQVDRWHELGAHLGLTEDQLKRAKKRPQPTASVLIDAKINNIDLMWNKIVESLLRIGEYELAESICNEYEGHTGWVPFIKFLVDSKRLHPTEPLSKTSPDTLLSVACARGQIGVIDYLVKVKGCDAFGPVNPAGETLRSIADSLGLSNVLRYLESLGSDLKDPVKQKYMRKLDELMKDTVNTILLYYLKMFFIGSSGLGKSTTRKRLTEEIKNLASSSKEERKRCSTHLAEYSQVLAFMDEDKTKLTLKASRDPIKQMQAMFAYVYSCKVSTTDHAPSPEDTDHSLNKPSSGGRDQLTGLTSPTSSTNESSAAMTEVSPQPMLEEREQLKVTTVDVNKVISGLHDLVSSGEYIEQLANKILLNLVDIGGQPGFLEMLPSLSKGPGMFLAFFRLDKDLDEPCEVSYEREGDKITKHYSVYTNRETLSQILSAIKHHVKLDTALDQELLSKQADLSCVKPIATLVGTFKDKLETKVKAKVLQEKLSTEFLKASESEKEEVIKHALASSTGAQSGDQPTAKINTDMLSKVNRLLASESFAGEAEGRLDQELKKKQEAISTITCNFKDLLSPPADGQHFIAIDNFRGSEADIDPLREHLQKLFDSFFKGAQLRIRPTQLLLGIVLRKEYNIVSMDDCIHIGRALNMVEEEVRFSVWYLDRWVGALIYQPEIEEEWFKKYIICSPQVVFDSISFLIVEVLLDLHCPDGTSRRLAFTAAEKENWVRKGQFSLDTVKRCLSKENKDKVEQDKLISLEMLVRFLEHSNLLSKITIKKKDGTEEVMCFIPAILECASHDELTKTPSPDADTPSPIKITFESGYVPTGVFCAMISQLVSRGSAHEGILGIKWEVVESGVKRNCLSFRVDRKQHIITLISHANCYEIRVIRQNRSISLHDLCSYVLSTVLYVLKEVNNNVDPIIAFDCQCCRHKPSSVDKLCQLLPGVSVCFECKYNDSVSLSASQECWFAKEVKSTGCKVRLKALPYVRRPDKSLSFDWFKDGSDEGTGNELKLDSVTWDDCDGYYTCEILKDDKPYFFLYRCIRIAKQSVVSSEDQLFDDVRQATKEVRAAWYSLAIELGIDYGTRKAIESDYHYVDVCFHAVLRHWVRKTSPPLMWTAIVRALKSPVINRGDIAEDIESTQDVTGGPGKDDVTTTPPQLQDPLSVDMHLKTVIEATWEVRAQWHDLGVELKIKEGTLKKIDHDCFRRADDCFTRMLEEWLITKPKWTGLIDALKSCTVGREDIARDIEAKLSSS